MKQKHDTRKMHDKARGMVKETSRIRFMEEQKDREHELTHHRTEIHKLLNEHYQYLTTERRKNGYMVKFQNPETHKMQKLMFQFETNLRELEEEWNAEH